MSDEASKNAILKRRARFIAAALASAGIGAAVSCGGESTQNAPQQSVDAGTDADGSPQPCLGALPNDAGKDADAGPQPCLEPLIDASSDADAEPQPCLAPPPPDAGGDGAPQPCLSPPAPDSPKASGD